MESQTAMGSVETAARQLYAAHKADGRIPRATCSAPTWK
jgi:hypothetical protein